MITLDRTRLTGLLTCAGLRPNRSPALFFDGFRTLPAARCALGAAHRAPLPVGPAKIH